MDLEQMKIQMTETLGVLTTAAFMSPEVFDDNIPT
jgi:hypothetical protein